MAAPRNNTYTVTSGDGVYAGRPRPGLAPFEVTADGIHTWFTRPEGIRVGGFVYSGSVSSDGRCRAHQINQATEQVKTFDLSGVLEVDDHNNSSVLPLSDGRIAFFFGSHNDTQFKYRVWNGVGDFELAGSWAAAEQRGVGNGPYSYPNPIIFSQDAPRTWLFKRRWIDGGGGTRRLAYRTATSLLTAPPHTWSAFTDVYGVSGRIPYWRTATDRVNRVHFAITTGHPVEGQTSLGHFYGQLDGSNVMRWYRSDGTEITASLPFTFSDITQIYDGSSVRCWVSDCAIGADGRPRVLWMRYPNNNGTLIEIWHSRWTAGNAWVSHKVTDDGAGLYAGEPFYHGGAAFDRADPTKFALAPTVSGVRQVQEWQVDEVANASSKLRDITTGGSAGNPLKFRPFGVENHDGGVRFIHAEGIYDSFVSYNTSQRAWG